MAQWYYFERTAIFYVMRDFYFRDIYPLSINCTMDMRKIEKPITKNLGCSLLPRGDFRKLFTNTLQDFFFIADKITQ